MISDMLMKCRKFLRGLTLTALVLLPFQQLALSQENQPRDTSQTVRDLGARPTIAKIASVGLAGGTLVYSAGVWWVNDYRPFHFWKAPWFLGLGVDKIGHAYTSYFMFHSIDDILKWGGNSEDASFWWATGVAAFHGLFVEVGDGFSEYGFDYKDVTFNYTGLGYAILQEKVPFFRNFDFKWSLYYPLNRHSFKINYLYHYHIYWMSARIHELLPAPAKPYWPSFLQVAFGLGANADVTRRTYVLSFDYNLERIPIEGEDATLVKKVINMFHLPAPGVRFMKGAPPEFQLLLLY